MTPSTFMVIAHRGASAYAPENTLAAFDLAIRMGVRHIEFDVHSSCDGHIVVIHDDTLDRTTNGSGPVSNHTLAPLRELDAGSWFGAAFAGERVPTFDDVLSRYGGRIHIHAEIKGHSASLSRQRIWSASMAWWDTSPSPLSRRCVSRRSALMPLSWPPDGWCRR